MTSMNHGPSTSELPTREATQSLNLGKATTDPITLGFEKLNIHFDHLDRRVESLERPSAIHNGGFDSEYDDADQEWEDYRRSDHRGKFGDNRSSNLRGRGHARNNRGGRGNRFGEVGYQIYGNRFGEGGYSTHVNRNQQRDNRELRQNRRRNNLDPPLYRHDTWENDDQYDYRAPTCWDPPQRRGRYNHQPHVHPTGVKMDAPHFDGSDAANWISRVHYYFDHMMIPETDRLHYVVMLFDPPASEWIFNYRANNGFVTWSEFLEDVRHRFDPHSFRNYTGLIAKLMQTTTVAEYHNTFERYLNRMDDLSESALIPIFIQGLKQPIQEKVELQHPASLAEAMALALRLAATQEERHHQSSSFSRNNGLGGTLDSQQQRCKGRLTPREVLPRQGR